MAQILNGGTETASITGQLGATLSHNGVMGFGGENFLSHYHHQRHYQQQHQPPHQQHPHYHHHGNQPTAHYHYHTGHFVANHSNSIESLNSLDNHVTVVQIEQLKQQQQQQQQSAYYHANGHLHPMYNTSNGIHQLQQSDFVTVLQIVSTNATVMTTSSISHDYVSSNGHHLMPPTQTITSPVSSTQTVFVDSKRGEIEEEVTIYRLPGERLGMALRFDGGQSASETIRRVFVQNITTNTPASKAIGLMLGILREGDEILKIDDRLSSTLTRLECITLLRDAPVCIRLLVRRTTVPNVSTCGQCCEANCVPNCMMKTNCCHTPPTNGYSYGDTSPNNGTNYYQTLENTPQLISTTTPMINQLIYSCADHSQQQIVPKKVPPPVPPRMATTTLTSKRKPKPLPTPPPLETVQPIISSNEFHSSHNCNGNSCESAQCVPIEKPPRRRNQHSNPPPLPPRRPKGPPPKPPIDRIQTSTNVMTVTSTSITTTTSSSKSLPTLVTVITTKVSNGDINCSPPPSNDSPTMNTGSISTLDIKSSTPVSRSPKNIPVNNISSGKVSLTISNSKVSSFIRQTAERLHRKLSGKSTINEEEDNCRQPIMSMNRSPSGISSDFHTSSPETVQSLLENGVNKTTPTTTTTTTTAATSAAHNKIDSTNDAIQQISMPSPAAYVDSCQDNEDNLVYLALDCITFF